MKRKIIYGFGVSSIYCGWSVIIVELVFSIIHLLGVSCHDHEFTYEKGKSYEIKDFDLAYNEECSTGIHFFKTRKEAEEYDNN